MGKRRADNLFLVGTWWYQLAQRLLKKEVMLYDKTIISFLVSLVFSVITNFNRSFSEGAHLPFLNRQEIERKFKSFPTDAYFFLSLIICQCEFILIFNGCLISSKYFTKNLHQMECILFWKMNRQDLQTLMTLIRRHRLWGLRILTSLHL